MIFELKNEKSVLRPFIFLYGENGTGKSYFTLTTLEALFRKNFQAKSYYISNFIEKPKLFDLYASFSSKKKEFIEKILKTYFNFEIEEAFHASVAIRLFTKVAQIVNYFFDEDLKVKNDLHYIAVFDYPESHLYPKVQINFLNFLMDIQKTSKNIYFVIETASEYFLNYLGHKINKSEFNQKDIVVLTFNFSKDTNKIKIINSYFKEDGVLMNWRLDIFAYENM